MPLVDMKRTKKEAKDNSPEVAKSSMEEKYPWGLSITLEKESLEKLGIDVSKCGIGDKVMIEAECEVSNISMSERIKGQDQKTLGLQITRMAVDTSKKKKSSSYFKRQGDGPGGEVY